ncbi:MAG TPA: sigma-70 family RNA polymerase sigma factor [Candidatus Sulfomarinibacteraceae bacterium]|nr:sigma-70 family RNA polymerase sigma factor [Candidatus Sulfomarinibacteraceae bacterium]
MVHRNSDSNGLDVRRLISRAVDGDMEAFEKLYGAYMEPIYRYILLRVGQRSAAEMLTEDTFVEAWEKLVDYRHRSAESFSIWLYRLARSVVVDYLYENREVSSLGESESFGDIEPLVSPNGTPDAPVVLPSDLSLFSLPTPGAPLLTTLLEALRELNDMEQDVAILAFVEKLPMRTVGSIIDRDVEACRQIQKRVLLTLVQFLRYQPLDDDEQ